MQLLFQSAFLADLPELPANNRIGEFLSRPELHSLITFVGVFLIVAQIARIVAIWISSKIVAIPEAATVVNALKMWLADFILWVAVFGGTIFVMTNPAFKEDHGRQLIILGGILILWLVLVFAIPMKVFAIGFLHAFGLLILTGLISGAVMGGFRVAAAPVFQLDKVGASIAASIGKTDAEKQSFLKRLFGLEAPDEIDRLLDDALHPIGPTPPLHDREAMVGKIQQKLAAQQQSLAHATPEATAAFQVQLARYTEFLNQVKAERAAAPAGQVGVAH